MPDQKIPSIKPITPLRKVALAILYREGQFLMQLRDDFPHIVHPGIWGFFGGHIEPGESAHTSIVRELQEEIGYAPPKLVLFRQERDAQSQRYYYHGELAVPVGELKLNEGQDLALCSAAEIRLGEKHSAKLDEVRSIGKPHQKVLLAFIKSSLINLKSIPER